MHLCGFWLQAREDELRIQKRFLNDMFAKVKQEFLEKRLRQQQIEVMLGHKSQLPALPSTAAADAAAEQPGSSNALALRASSESTAEPSEASPGELCSIACLQCCSHLLACSPCDGGLLTCGTGTPILCDKCSISPGSCAAFISQLPTSPRLLSRHVMVSNDIIKHVVLESFWLYMSVPWTNSFYLI